MAQTGPAARGCGARPAVPAVRGGSTAVASGFPPSLVSYAGATAAPACHPSVAVRRPRRRLRLAGRGRPPVRLRRGEVALFLPEIGQAPLVRPAVVVDRSVDVRAIDDRVGAQRMVRPDDEVGVLAGFERADAVVDPQLLRRVDRHERERLVVGQSAPADRLGGLGVQPPRVLRAVGVDRDEDPFARHDGRVVGDGVGRFDLVAPPVGERRRAGAVRRDLLRDLVAFEHVLERRDLEAHLFGEADEHQDFVGAVAMRVDQALALEDFDERFELQVAARRGAGRFVLLVLLPRFLVGLGPDEGVADHEFHAAARDRIPARPLQGALAEILRVLAERELDAGHGAGEQQLLRARLSPAQLDDRVLAADRIGAAVEDVRGRDAAGEIAIDVDVGRIEHVLHPGHGADGRPAFVDRIVREVRVRVDHAG